MSNQAKKQVENNEAAMTVVKNIEEPVQVTVVEPVPELSLDEKIAKVEDLTMLIDKFRKLKESRRNLQSFKLTADGMNTQLFIRDVNTTSEFKTFNTAVLSRVLEVIKQSLDEKIAEVEAQIRF